MGSRRWSGRVRWKDETRNPTGSQKDRPLARAATNARGAGARLFVAFSAGFVGLVAVAYAARAGLPAAILMSEGGPAGRTGPLACLGARLFEVPADTDEGIAALSRLAGRHGIDVASTTRAANPVQAEAARTLAFEIVEDLGRAPERVVAPIGGGGTVAALHDGFAELRDASLIERVLRVVAVVPDRQDLRRTAFAGGIETPDEFAALAAPAGGPTILNTIAHAHAPDGEHAQLARRKSGGAVLAVSDDEALAAVTEVGRHEGLYLEPSSTITWPALLSLDRDGARAGSVTVALACGSGFRETRVMLDRSPARRAAPPLEAMEDRLAALAGAA